MCRHQEHRRYQDCGCGEHHIEQHREGSGCSERYTGHHEENRRCGGHNSEHHKENCTCSGSGEQAFRSHHQNSSGACACGCHADQRLAERTFWRRFSSREERIAWLEQYLKDLRAEAQAVEERIAEMRTP